MSEYPITAQLFKVIMKIRNAGNVNMFDTQGVMLEAMELGIEGRELVQFLSKEENKQLYTAFILKGANVNPETIQAYEETH